MKERERRLYPVGDIEFRETGGGQLLFRGHAAVFDKLSDPIFGFREKVAAGAFKKTVREGDVAFLYQHEPATVMARTRAQNLRLKEDKTGLLTEADLDPNDPDVRRLQIKMQNGNIDQMSFGFQTVKDEWDESDEHNVIRTLREVKLFDVSPVTFPAYTDTDAELKGWVPAEVRAIAERMAHDYDDESRASVDDSAWDGNAAMSACDDGACYKAICAGRKAGDPDLRQSWALPHHKAQGDPPNAAGVRNALSRLPQTQGLTNKAEAKSHLEAHLATIQAQSNAADYQLEHALELLASDELRVGKVLSGKNRDQIQAVIDSLGALLKDTDGEPEQKQLSVAMATARLELLKHTAA